MYTVIIMLSLPSKSFASLRRWWERMIIWSAATAKKGAETNTARKGLCVVQLQSSTQRLALEAIGASADHNLAVAATVDADPVPEHH